jgi:protein gp37
MGKKKYENGFELTLHPESLNDPYSWRKPQMIFVNSMSDLFHPDVPDKFIMDVFNTMNNTNHHIYQVLTKRSERLADLAPKLHWTKNIWMGVTVEESRYVNRIDDLEKVPSSIRFLSIEPLLGDMGKIDLNDIHWVIVGGESGPKSRLMEAEWVHNIKKQCLDQNVPFFFKQWGGIQKKKAGRILDNKTWDNMPDF